MPFKKYKLTNHSISMKSLVCGVGINDADYQVSSTKNNKMCKYYAVWLSMIARCYSELYFKSNKNYLYVSVCDQWLRFSNFKTWMKSQDHEGKFLDKDIINPNNKVYSPGTCAFVTREVNNILGSMAARRGKYPQGVKYEENNKNYVAVCRVAGKRVHIGVYDNPGDAQKAYNKVKYDSIIALSRKQDNKMVAEGLIRHAGEKFS